MDVQAFWENRYRENKTGWDLGNASPPLMGFMQQWQNKQAKILIPGAGNAYEAQWLYEQGFTQVHVVDIASAPLQNLKERCPGFPDAHLHHQDFFELEDTFELILEQTFFCALAPEQRGAYVKKMHTLLKPGGMLVGVLFTFPLSASGPPFGGSLEEYKKRFSAKFKIAHLERCYNSIKPRLGNEAFIQLLKP